MTTYISIELDARRYEDCDDCLAAAEADYAAAHDLAGWDLTPHWTDDSRYTITLTVPNDLVLCTSADGWSLHAPGSTDEQIATGDAPYLVSGDGEPTQADYAAALAAL